MPVSDDPRYGPTRLSFADTADIDTFVEMLGRFERGEITPDEWRKFRLLRGTYAQRQDLDAQMMRIKIPQGIIDAAQLEALADVAERHSRGFGHISTRQNMQLHFVPLHDMEPAMRRIAETGMTTREACGNSVRNITTCPYAGVARDEVFDVTPYAEAMTRYLLRHPLSSTLPRKFKIAFEGCASEDHVATAINDLAWRATLAPDGSGRRGFKVGVAGGTAIMCRSAAALFEFLPASDILMVAEAVLRVFQRYGDYEHKARNRMKFLVKTMGWDAWFAAFEQELAEVRAAGEARLPFDPDNPPAVEEAPAWERAEAPSLATISTLVNATAVRGPGIVPVFETHDGGPGRERTEWLRTNVQPQKQPEYSIVTVFLVLGDITAGQMRAVAALSRAYADGFVRVTVDQNLSLRWVRSGQLPGLYRRLAAAGLARSGAGTISDVTSCPGAESCRLAVTQSRGLARLIETNLRERPASVRSATDVRIKDQRVPERMRSASCGRHRIPGQHPQGRRSCRAAVFPDARRRRRPRGCELRAADGEDSGASHSRRRRSHDPPLRGGTHPGRNGARLLPPGRASSREGRARGPREDDARGHRAGGLHRSGRRRGLQSRGDGRRMQRVKGGSASREIVVPASIANLGPGLDTLGLAVGLYLRVRVTRVIDDGLGRLTCRFAGGPLGGPNRIQRAFAALAPKRRRSPSLEVEVASDIPMRSGLGSSAAATIAGLRLRELVDGARTGDEILSAASKIEGHPDNVAAALFGGVTSCCPRDDGTIAVAKWPWPAAWRIVVATPDVELATSLSRRALPSYRSVTRCSTCSTSLLLGALQSGHAGDMREALRDRAHQPYRQALVPGLRRLLALRHPDVIGVCLSGAGPSIAAFASRNAGAVEKILREAYAKERVRCTVRTVTVHREGDA